MVGGRIFGSIFDFFPSCLEVVLKLFGHCFWTQKARTCVYYRPKKKFDDNQNRDFLSNFDLRVMVLLTIFDHFQARKNHFLDLLKVGLELFGHRFRPYKPHFLAYF